jgi:hypothetical protein
MTLLALHLRRGLQAADIDDTVGGDADSYLDERGGATTLKIRIAGVFAILVMGLLGALPPLCFSVSFCREIFFCTSTPGRLLVNVSRAAQLLSHYLLDTTSLAATKHVHFFTMLLAGVQNTWCTPPSSAACSSSRRHLGPGYNPCHTRGCWGPQLLG